MLTWSPFMLRILFSRRQSERLRAQKTVNTFVRVLVCVCVRSVICEPVHFESVSGSATRGTRVSRHSAPKSPRTADYFLFNFQISHIVILCLEGDMGVTYFLLTHFS